MASLKRKAEVESDGESSGSDDQFEATGNKNIDVDFEFFDPEETDFHSVKNLTVGLMDGEVWDSSSLADCIVNQGNIGTVVKGVNKESDSLFSVLTVLNFQQYADVVGLTQLKEYLLTKAAKADPMAWAKMKELLDDENAKVGLVINERLLNLPFELVPPLFKCLRDDIKWSQETPECPEDERPHYFYTHYIFLTKFQRDNAAPAGDGKLDKPKKKKSKKANLDNVAYAKWEDELFAQRAQWKVSYGATKKTSAKSTTGPDVTELRLLYCLTEEDFNATVKELLAIKS